MIEGILTSVTARHGRKLT